MADEISMSSTDVTNASSDELTQIRAQCDEYLAGWKRAQADYANSLKERERDRSEYVKYANATLLQSLLPAIEYFATALRHIPDASTLPEEVRKPWESWITGVKAVQTLWEQAAQGAGLERIPTHGTFDPAQHEAVGHEASEAHKTDEIVRVTEDGWRLNGRVLRPAKVIVAS